MPGRRLDNHPHPRSVHGGSTVHSNVFLKALKAPLAAALCFALAMPPAWAQTPDLRLSDLVNQGSDYAQRELRSRGFVFIHADQRGSKLWQYWWNARDNVCARVAHVDGRASSIVDVSATDCNQYPQTYGQPAQQPAPQSGESKGMSNATKAAIAAAAIAGVAVLAHRSHERDEQKHKNEQQTAEFERGYRDGLYHQPYHDYNRSQSYVDGYNAGQQKREAETAHRSPYAYHSGQAAYVPLNDLVGARAQNMDDELGRRGFVRKGGWQSGYSAYSMWWNGSTRQCIQGVVSDGRIQSINPIVEGNCL
jgi:hypothetical protein